MTQARNAAPPTSDTDMNLKVAYAHTGSGAGAGGSIQKLLEN